MLDLVGSEIKPPHDTLISKLSSLRLDGTLYVGYPVLATIDEPIFIDALLVSRQHGLVVFDLEKDDLKSDGFWDKVQEKQNDLYSSLLQKLFGYKELRTGKRLAIEINVITYLPYDGINSPDKDEILVAGPATLQDRLSSLPSFNAKYLKPLNAVIQRVTTIKPRKKRSSVKRHDSRGAILKQIEQEIANLDRWQNHAAIESPDGPQRIRGLAGSGKTIVLALKAAYLHTRHPDWEIAITFQTRSLYQQFTDLVRRFTFEHTQDEPDWSKLHIIHAWGSQSQPGLYAQIAMAHNLEPKNFGYGQQKYGRQKAFEGVCQELLAHIQKRKSPPLYDALLIDEAQDFPISFFQLAYQVVKAPKRIVWAYDELQNLSDYRMAPPEELFGRDRQGQPLVTLENKEGKPRQDIILPVCYRNTPWALATAHALGFGIYRQKSLVQYFDDPELWDKMGYELLNGDYTPGHQVTMTRKKEASPSYFQELLQPADAVQCHIFSSAEEQAAWVAASIKKDIERDELEASDILIILPEAYTAQSDALPIITALRQAGLQAHLTGVNSSKDEIFLDNSIAIAHIHRAKGNEAPMVYLLNSQYGFEGPELIKRRNALFTAITRSRAWVRVCGYGPAMADLKVEIERVIQNEFKLEFTVPHPDELAQIRKIHRDRTKGEQEEIEKIHAAVKKYIAGVETGDISPEAIPRSVREKLRAILQ
jgi:superfamily I DNA and RNA helicase